MHIPENRRKPIIYVTTAVLLFGGIVYEYKHGQIPEPVKQSASLAAINHDLLPAPKTNETQDQASAPTPLAAESTPPAKAEQQPRQKVETYKVVDGDTVGGVAERFGLKTDTILWANDMDETDTLQIGQELQIPAVDGVVYTVADGDTLWDIAEARGAEVDAIIKANPDLESGSIQVGQTLLVPGGTPAPRRLLASRDGGSASRPVSHALDYWPTTGPLTDPFGWRTHPVYGTQSFHDGMDIGVGSGTPLVAAAGGTVIMAERYGGYGLSIRIEHGRGVVTQYAHLSKIDVEVGQEVGAGEHIGYSGNTGVSTGPHLHFMVLVNGSPSDPASWLP